jgi:hypothetical protein
MKDKSSVWMAIMSETSKRLSTCETDWLVKRSASLE